MGRGIIESGLFRSERYVLELRTSDPASHSEGEMWVRTDIAPDTDQLATLRFDNGSGIWDIPIYNTAASVDGVKKIQRIPIGGTIGFVPVVERGGAFSSLRLQHNNAWHGAHDAVESSAPISEDLQARYDATELSLADGDTVSTWPDKTANGNDLSAGEAPTYAENSINGNPTVRHNGNYYLKGQFASTPSQPFHIFGVGVDRNGANDSQTTFWDGWSKNEARLFGDNNSFSNSWTMFAGSRLQGGTEDTNAHVFSCLYNGSRSVLRVDGSQLNSGSVGSSSLSGITTGARADGSNFGNVDIGEILVYSTDKSASQSDIEQHLADKWGITL